MSLTRVDKITRLNFNLSYRSKLLFHCNFSGGGLGGTRVGGPDDNVRHSGRAEQYEG